MNNTTKQERIESVITKHGEKNYTIKRLASYAHVSPKTFRVRISKMKAAGRVSYANPHNNRKNYTLDVYVAIA